MERIDDVMRGLDRSGAVLIYTNLVDFIGIRGPSKLALMRM